MYLVSLRMRRPTIVLLRYACPAHSSGNSGVRRSNYSLKQYLRKTEDIDSVTRKDLDCLFHICNGSARPFSIVTTARPVATVQRVSNTKNTALLILRKLVTVSPPNDTAAADDDNHVPKETRSALSQEADWPRIR